MPRSSRHPRALGRFAKTKALAMRNPSTGRPDVTDVVVEDRLADGRYKVRRDSWPFSIYVPVVPAGALIPYPLRMKMMFEDGLSSRPFLYWPQAAPHLLGPGMVAAPLIWRRFGSFQHAYGAEMLTPQPAEVLALTEVKRTFYAVPLVLSFDGEPSYAVAIRSSKWDACYIDIFNFATGEDVWEEPVLVAGDPYPQLEYLPGHDAIAVMHNGGGLLLDRKTGGQLASFPRVTGGLVEGRYDRRWYYTAALDTSLYRYTVPDLTYSSILPEVLWPVQRDSIAFATSAAETEPRATYLKGVSLENHFSAGALFENTKIFYQTNLITNEVSGNSDMRCEAYLGFGFRWFGKNVPRYAALQSPGSSLVNVTASTQSGLKAPSFKATTRDINYAQVDRIGILVELTLADGTFLTWERVWKAKDHTPAWHGLANAQAELSASVAQFEKKAYNAAYATNGPDDVSGALLTDWDMTIDVALESDPFRASYVLSQDLIAGGHPLTGTTVGYAISALNVHLDINAYQERPYNLLHPTALTLDQSYNWFWRNGDQMIGQYAPVYYADTLHKNLNNARVKQTRICGNKIVVNYQTPSYLDVSTRGFINVRQWSGSRTGNGFDQHWSFPNVVAHLSDYSQLTGLWETAAANSALVIDGSRWIYRPLQGTPGWWSGYQPVQPGDALAFAKNYYMGVTEIYSSFTCGNLVWDGGWTGSPSAVTDFGKDFNWKAVPWAQGVPVNGKSAITVLEVIGGKLTELCTLEFGSNGHILDAYLGGFGLKQKYSDGTFAEVSVYPETDGIPGYNGLFVYRKNYAYPLTGKGNHTTLIERYAWAGGVPLWSLTVVGNPWESFYHCGHDEDLNKDWILIQDKTNKTLHLYNQDGFVRSYGPMEATFKLDTSWVVRGNVYYSVPGAPVIDGDFQATANRIIKL